jgi:hypothetical protein
VTDVVSRMLDQVKHALPPLRSVLLRRFEGSFLKTMFDNYHPEQHYMRGSGPKSRSMDSKEDMGSKQP